MNSTTDKSNNIKKTALLIMAIVLLVVFPLLAVYMSSSGLSAYKQLKAEMKAYKDSLKLPGNDFLSITKDIETNIDFYKGKVLIAHFYDKNCTNCDTVWSELKRIQSEFNKKTKRVQLLTYVLKEDSIPALKGLITNNRPDTSSWEILVSKDEDMYSFLSSIKVDSQKANTTFVLIDRNGIIANYYDAAKTSEVNNLMKHATLLLPAKEDRRKIRYKREKDLYQ